MAEFVRLEAISKSFYGTSVLSDVDLHLNRGEVHSLVGENGAGKSTLMKVIAGAYRPSSGKIFVDGHVVSFSSPADAYKSGIYLVQQEPALFQHLTVAENIFMGILPRHKNRAFGIDKKQVHEQAQQVIDSLNLELDVEQLAGGLSIANQQMIEIAKALVRKVKLLILDEPTSTLSVHEVESLFGLIQKMRSDGVTVLFISHRLEEVYNISSRVTVLRDGRNVGSFDIDKLDRDQLVRLMVGREIPPRNGRSGGSVVANPGAPVLQVENLCSTGQYKNVSFVVQRGEVVGLAGLIGAGRTEIAETIFGIRAPSSGTVHLDGKLLNGATVKQAIRRGVVYIPEDRHAHGVSLSQSILENISSPWLSSLRRIGLVSATKQKTLAEGAATRLGVRMRGVRQLVRELSGGNQQKVVIGKWLQGSPKMVIFDEPTRGVDVGAKAEIHKIIEELAGQGVGIIVISSDLPEVLALSDRVLVVREGTIAAELTGDHLTEEQVIRYATGV